MFTAVIMAAMLQTAAINSQRDNYMTCLEKAVATAKAQKMAPDALEPLLKQNCASIAETFMSSLVAFDVKNKVPRKQAAADAQVQVDDLLSGMVSQYRLQTGAVAAAK